MIGNRFNNSLQNNRLQKMCVTAIALLSGSYTKLMEFNYLTLAENEITVFQNETVVFIIFSA